MHTTDAIFITNQFDVTVKMVVPDTPCMFESMEFHYNIIVREVSYDTFVVTLTTDKVKYPTTFGSFSSAMKYVEDVHRQRKNEMITRMKSISNTIEERRRHNDELTIANDANASVN